MSKTQFKCLWALPRLSSRLSPSPLLALARRHLHKPPIESETTRYGVRQAIYLALRDVFKRGPSHYRNSRDVRKVIKMNMRRREVCDLVDMYGLGFVCDMTRVMLHQRIFTSLHRAKVNLPDLFGLIKMPEKLKGGGPYAAMQAKADLEAQLDRLTIADVSRPPDKMSFTSRLAEDTTSDVSITPVSDDTAHLRRRDRLLPCPEETLPPFPTKLPFAAQHEMLRRLQTILEAVCYGYGMRVMPRVMRLRRWDCPEAAELHEMVDTFMSKDEHFLETGRTTVPLEELLQSISLIRHAAVHRIPMTVVQANKFLRDAEALALMLGDRPRAAAIVDLADAAAPVMDRMMRQVRGTRSRLVQTLDDFSARRDELRRLETEAIEGLARENAECRKVAGERIQEIFTPIAKPS
ncbi:hypothetical protein HRG_006354 [Hirsutella rhossiliensis]|uniref:Uncharacterized protein n=1 Tax=Hirsutella rhossiliensis TaxID=111463 RepID=A0A9P8MVN9_9HYPO|nr:uncharacterized protein HRG_06354 [Hirsutella rhossiliensis]KAH0962252.1 hypothetical protein HRG_06354 [Hirsutella rhossiliensis]